jgi:putative transposase
MKGRWPITLMCEVLEVSPSGYFSWNASGRRPARGPSRYHSDEALLVHIRAIHEQLRGEYGWPRMHKESLTPGLRVSKERVRQLPTHKASRIEELLPHRWQPIDI